jgi:hypothetical protein
LATDRAASLAAQAETREAQLRLEHANALSQRDAEATRLRMELQIATLQQQLTSNSSSSGATSSSTSSSSSSSSGGVATIGELASMSAFHQKCHLFSDVSHLEAIAGPAADPVRSFPILLANAARVYAAAVVRLQAQCPGGAQSTVLLHCLELHTADRVLALPRQMVTFKLDPSNVTDVPVPSPLSLSFLMRMFMFFGLRFSIYGPEYVMFFPILLQEFLVLHLMYDFSLEIMYRDLCTQFTAFYWVSDRDETDPTWLRTHLETTFLPSRREGVREAMYSAQQSLRMARLEQGITLRTHSSVGGTRTSPATARTPSPRTAHTDPSAPLHSASMRAARGALGSGRTPSLLEQPGLSKPNFNQPSANSHPCWIWILKGCPTPHCGTASCWRFHQFHPQETPAAIAAYKAWVKQYCVLP